MNRGKDSSLAGDEFDEEMARLEAFADVSNGWFWETDENHNFIYLSSSVERLSGRAPEWHYGKSRADVGGSNVRPEIWQAHLDDLAARRPFDSFVYRRLTSHAELWIRTGGAPRFNAQGVFLGYRGFASNITAEIMVRREAGLLKEAIQQITEPFVLWGADERLVACNDAYLKLNENFASMLVPGISFEEVLRAVANDGHVMAAVGREEEWVLERLATHRLPEHSHYLQLSGDRHMMIHQQKLSNGAVAWFGLDITQLKQAERRAEDAHRQLTDAIEAVPDGFCLYDADERLVLFNSHYATFLETFGVEAKVGLRYEDALRKAADSGLFEVTEASKEEWIQNRLALHCSHDIVRFDRAFKGGWVRVIESSTTDGSRVGLRIDISELKAQEAELQRAREVADIANSAKSMFLANMSHELRTPLNAILGFSEMITHFVDKPERNQEYANYISTSGRHLLTVINEVLDYSKIEAGKMELTREDVRFADIVREIHPLIEFQLKTAGLTMRQEVPQNLLINVDPQALRQMLVNLLSNAIKFSPDGREILLRVGLHPETCEIAVIDKGVGIPSAQLDAVMMPFQQARNDYVATGETGTGLGLAIVDNLMRLHGGTVRIESEEGVGTTVRLLFPADIVVPKSSTQPTLTVVASRT